jgi:hypothetical protein
MEVQNDFHLATVDIVTDPSGPDCFVEGILENTQYFFDIATSSWKPSASEAAIIVAIADKEVPSNVSQEHFEEAMNRLQRLEDAIHSIKESFSKPSKKIDENAALRMFETYVSTLKN